MRVGRGRRRGHTACPLTHSLTASQEPKGRKEGSSSRGRWGWFMVYITSRVRQIPINRARSCPDHQRSSHDSLIQWGGKCPGGEGGKGSAVGSISCSRVAAGPRERMKDVRVKRSPLSKVNWLSQSYLILIFTDQPCHPPSYFPLSLSLSLRADDHTRDSFRPVRTQAVAG